MRCGIGVRTGAGSWPVEPGEERNDRQIEPGVWGDVKLGVGGWW